MIFKFVQNRSKSSIISKHCFFESAITWNFASWGCFGILRTSSWWWALRFFKLKHPGLRNWWKQECSFYPRHLFILLKIALYWLLWVLLLPSSHLKINVKQLRNLLKKLRNDVYSFRCLTPPMWKFPHFLFFEPFPNHQMSAWDGDGRQLRFGFLVEFYPFHQI